MYTFSPLMPFAFPPLLPPVKPFPNPRFSSRFPRVSSRCMHKSLNLSSNPTVPSTVSFAPANDQAPLGTTTTSDKLRLLVSEFRSLTEPIDRVKRLLNYAAALTPLDDSARVSSNRVTGCTTQVWIEIKMDEFGRMRFKADSDSEISKGFCSCLIWILDGAKPEEVMGVRSEDLSDMNVGVYGKEKSRVNTWHNVLMTMQKRTIALVTKAEMANFEEDTQTRHHEFLFKYVNGSYVESSSSSSSSKISDYSISLLPLYYDFTI